MGQMDQIPDFNALNSFWPGVVAFRNATSMSAINQHSSKWYPRLNSVLLNQTLLGNLGKWHTVRQWRYLNCTIYHLYLYHVIVPILAHN